MRDWPEKNEPALKEKVNALIAQGIKGRHPQYVITAVAESAVAQRLCRLRYSDDGAITFFSALWPYWPELVAGLWVTIQLTALATLGGPGHRDSRRGSA